jgi:hypothetical protein
VNREAFEATVAKKSPLKPEQFDAMFGTVDDENKATAWALMNWPTKQQLSAWLMVKPWLALPEAKVIAVR